MALDSGSPAGGMVRASPLVQDSSLENWRVFGAGGFGQIFRVRHRQWCCDVAVKVLHCDDGTSLSLQREGAMMCRASSPFVTQVLGVYRGQPNPSGPLQLGLVMEFMERGSLAAMQRTLQGPPPGPLVLRLAHQVALGLNFLHNLTPALLHLDLKPSNVLLDSSLNAKLTDFGLATCHRSGSRASRSRSGVDGGTWSYTPPEAFDLSYTPTLTYDIYSYGILLWSIVTGKQPYPDAMSSLVRFSIPRGSRPALEEVPDRTACRAELMELMVKCWEADLSQRPPSSACTAVTERLHQAHRRGVQDAVTHVLNKLEEEEERGRGGGGGAGGGVAEEFSRLHITRPSASSGVEAAAVCDEVPTGRPPVQEVACGQAVNVTCVKASPASASVKASTVHPIQSSPPPPPRRPPSSSSSSSSSRCSTKPTTKVSFMSPQCQRQFSSPDFCPGPPRVTINCSNVTGLQSGNYNNMHIVIGERRRHPTAPPTFDLPPPP